jgi:hypothetical protein
MGFCDIILSFYVICGVNSDKSTWKMAVNADVSIILSRQLLVTFKPTDM